MLLVDTREQKWAHIKAYLEAEEISFRPQALSVGDYQIEGNASISVDRKQNLQEIAGNLCQQHERFRRELIRAQEAGTHLIILCEHSIHIKSIDDVRHWDNPRLTKSPHAITGARMAAIMETMSAKYGVEWMFCSKKNTAQVICRLLNIGIDNVL